MGIATLCYVLCPADFDALSARKSVADRLSRWWLGLISQRVHILSHLATVTPRLENPILKSSQLETSQNCHHGVSNLATLFAHEVICFAASQSNGAPRPCSGNDECVISRQALGIVVVNMSLEEIIEGCKQRLP